MLLLSSIIWRRYKNQAKKACHASVSTKDSIIIDDEEEELDINKDNLINNSSEGSFIIIEEDRDCTIWSLTKPRWILEQWDV